MPKRLPARTLRADTEWPLYSIPVGSRGTVISADLEDPARPRFALAVQFPRGTVPGFDQTFPMYVKLAQVKTADAAHAVVLAPSQLAVLAGQLDGSVASLDCCVCFESVLQGGACRIVATSCIRTASRK